MNTPLRLIKPTKPQRATRTKVDTILLTPIIIKSWKTPPFQRPLKVNDKVLALAEQIKMDGGVLPGILTLGILDVDTYRVDGQHRSEAFLLSELSEGYADVRYHWFDSMAEMGLEFERLNSSLVRMRPDDILRAREASSESLTKLRDKCPFIGYDMIRRRPLSPILSMATVLRCWFASESEVPTAGGISATAAAERMTIDEADTMIGFLALADDAWGRELEYARVWSSHTLTLAMWLYRRTVIAQYSPATTRLTKDQFRKCLMSLTADGRHMDYLVGRMLNDRDRAPGYNRMKAIFARRMEPEIGKKGRLPGPAWAHGGGAGRRTAK